MTTSSEGLESSSLRLRGMILVTISSFGISFGGLISRQIEDADAWQINIHRSLATVVVVVMIFLFRHRHNAVERVVQIGWPGIFGALSMTVAGVAFMQAITTTTVANTLFTLSSIPFITAALAWVFLREHLTRVTLATMMVAACGVGVMLADGVGGGSLYGNAMALVTAVGFSGYAVIIRRHRSVDMMPAYILSSLLVCLIALVLRLDDWAISWWDFAMCFIWGGLLSGIGNILFIVATRYLYAAEVTLFMLLEFSLGPIWVWWFVGEAPTVLALGGGALIMSAVLIRTLYQVRETKRAAVARVRSPV